MHLVSTPVGEIVKHQEFLCSRYFLQPFHLAHPFAWGAIRPLEQLVCVLIRVVWSGNQFPVGDSIAAPRVGHNVIGDGLLPFSGRRKKPFATPTIRREATARLPVATSSFRVECSTS